MGIVGLGFAALGVAGGAVSGIRHAVIQHEKEKDYSVTFDLENAIVKMQPSRNFDERNAF